LGKKTDEEKLDAATQRSSFMIKTKTTMSEKKFQAYIMNSRDRRRGRKKKRERDLTTSRLRTRSQEYGEKKTVNCPAPGKKNKLY